MGLPEQQNIRFIKIPRALHSSDTGNPFSNCLVCNKYLLESGTPYMIEKAIRQYPDAKAKEIIFEYAMCSSCMVMMNASLSEESRQRISEYFAAHANLESRNLALLQNKTLRFQSWVNKCIIKNTPVSRSSEYQIMAQCDGKHMVFTHLPFAISGEAIEEMTALLSAKSLGEIDGFIGKYFTGPPEVSEILKRRLILV